MNDDRIIQLAPGGLEQLLQDSMPVHPPLSARAGGIAVMMHKAGRDAYAIAERLQVPVASVLVFLDRLKLSGAQKLPDAQEPGAPSLPGETIDDPAASEQLEPATEEPSSAPPQPPAALKSQSPRRDTRPDVELSDLQHSIIRRLRKAHVSAATIAKAMRLSADQVMRIAGEAP